MKKLIINSLACTALLFSSLSLPSCGGSDDVPETLSVPVTDKHFTGPKSEAIEIVDDNLEIKFEKKESGYDDSYFYDITVPVTIKVVGEGKGLSIYHINIDFLDANGAIFKTISVPYDVEKKIQEDISKGITGNSYKAEIRIEEGLSEEKTQKFVQEVKSAKGGSVDGQINEEKEEPQKKTSSGSLYVSDANFSGPFGDIIKIKDSNYRLIVERSIYKGKKRLLISVDIEVLKQSSQKIEKLELNLVNEAGTTLCTLKSYDILDLREMVNNGDVGKSCLIKFETDEYEEDVDIIKEDAVGIVGGPTKAYK